MRTYEVDIKIKKRNKGKTDFRFGVNKFCESLDNVLEFEENTTNRNYEVVLKAETRIDPSNMLKHVTRYIGKELSGAEIKITYPDGYLAHVVKEENYRPSIFSRKVTIRVEYPLEHRL